MQFGSTTVPPLSLAAVLGTGVLVLLVLWGVWRARRPVPDPLPVSPPRDHSAQPRAEDWTGEAAGGPADPPPPPRPLTVADAVAQRGLVRRGPAERGSDQGPAARGPVATHPVPERDRSSDEASSASVRGGRPGVAGAAGPVVAAATPQNRADGADGPLGEDGPEHRSDAPGVHAEQAPAPGVVGPSSGHARSGPRGDAEGPAAPPVAAHPPAPPDEDQPGVLPPWSTERTDPPTPGRDADPRPGAGTGSGPGSRAGHGAVDESGVGSAAGPDAGDGADDGAEPAVAPASDPHAAARRSPDPDGPPPVSRAVQQALAARAVQRARLHRPDPDEPAPPGPGDPQQELPLPIVPSARPADPPIQDARDRLLAVLLADPARAVDATRRLDDSRDQVEELGDALRRHRREVAAAVARLHDCGLDAVQIGRLSGMPVADVRAILDGEDAR